VALKPAFGGRLVAEIACSSPIQMATVRPGVLPLPEPREPRRIEVEHLRGGVRGRVRVLERWRDDDADLLANAEVVVGVGVGVDPDDLPLVRQCAEDLGAELCATRKVTDAGWMPRARQVGITGHSIAPRLYVAIGISGRFNHTIGVRQAGTIVGVNTDPDCELWEDCDIGLVADWREALPALVERLA
jgi:electron transfer flavoprotein alpha subunit